MKRLAFALLGLVACGVAPARSPEPTTVIAESATGTTPPPPAPDRDWSPVLERLRQARLPSSHVVVVDARVRLAASASGAQEELSRLASAKARSFFAATVIRDEAGALYVTTHLEAGTPFREADPLFELAGFVDKRALVPMLGASREASYADGSGYWLGTGLPLVLADRARPLSPLFAPLDVDIADRELTLSVSAPRAVAVPKDLAGTVLGCERAWVDGDEETRVAPLHVLEAEQHGKEPPGTDGTPIGLGRRGFPRFLCAPKGAIGVGRASLKGVDRCSGHPTVEVDGRILTTVVTPLAVVRGVVAESALTSGGGCGAGRMAPRKRAVVAVRGKADVVYPDGSAAGVYHPRSAFGASFSKVEGPPDLLCTKRSVAREPVCFRGSDAAQSGGLPLDDE